MNRITTTIVIIPRMLGTLVISKESREPEPDKETSELIYYYLPTSH